VAGAARQALQNALCGGSAVDALLTARQLGLLGGGGGLLTDAALRAVAPAAKAHLAAACERLKAVDGAGLAPLLAQLREEFSLVFEAGAQPAADAPGHSNAKSGPQKHQAEQAHEQEMPPQHEEL
jgi:hypothetical protein